MTHVHTAPAISAFARRALRFHVFGRLLIAGVLLAPLSLFAADVTIVPGGATWRYRDDGSDQGTAWRGTGFDDAGWLSGPAQLGYGEGDEQTVVAYGPDPLHKSITTYFRRTFNAGPSAYTSLSLQVLRDDGAVVYLNGAEVWRSNMPDGAVGFTTLAAANVSGAAESTFFTTTLDPALLVPGANVLAVEVHQDNPGSSDLSFDLRLIGTTNAPPSLALTRGPYLQMGTATGMRVRWRTNLASDSRVRYGMTAGTLDQVADDATATTEHEVVLSGLTAGTRYYYSVGSSAETLAGNDAEHFFTTSPLPAAAGATRVWVLGDSGTANSDAIAVRNAYFNFTGSTPTNLWLMLGDNAYETGADSEYQTAVFDMYPTMLAQSVLWPTIGNHDTAQSPNPPAGLPYFAMFSLPAAGEAGGAPSGTEKYYSFDYANIHFICLDSMTSDRSSTGPMLTWLRSDLESTTRTWIIAFWHHPPYSKGSHDSDVDTELTEMRTNTLPILEDYGVDLVLSGHSHSYERSFLIDSHYGLSSTFVSAMKKDGGSGQVDGTGAYRKGTAGMAPHEGAVYAVAGSSGQIAAGPLNHPAMYISLLNLGSMVLDVDGNRLDAKFLRQNGVVSDSFTIIKGPACSSPAIDVPPQSATVGPGSSVTLSVTASGAGPLEYQWFTGVSGNTASPVPAATASSLTVTPSSTTSYWVRVRNSCGPMDSVAATVTVSACSYTVSPPSAAFAAGGGYGSLTVTTSPACTWSTSPAGDPWITLTSGQSGTGNGGVTFTVAANGGAQRSSSLTVAGTVIPISQNAAPAGAPVGVNATATGPAQVTITWTAVAGATGYEVERRAPGNAVLTRPVATNAFVDNAVSAGTSYVYVVRALSAGGASANSAPDLATTVAFTDDPLVAGTRVKAVHLAQRRTAVNAVRALAGLAPATYTGAAVPGTIVAAGQIN